MGKFSDMLKGAAEALENTASNMEDGVYRDKVAKAKGKTLEAFDRMEETTKAKAAEVTPKVQETRVKTNRWVTTKVHDAATKVERATTPKLGTGNDS